jgi:amidophosphoribosyltransferase
MSDSIKHECGIAFIRLLKPPSYYQEKYGTPLYGLKKLYLLMEKQHNRGQDGAGVATIKLDIDPGRRYISRKRSNSNQPIKDIFDYIFKKFHKVAKTEPGRLKDPEWLKKNVAFTGEVLLGHLRYGTHGQNSIESCHPFLRQNNWMTRNLVLAGNFNMTNVDELFDQLVALGQFPKEKADTVTVLEKIGHFLDVENQRIFDKFKKQGFDNKQLSDIISEKLNLRNILKNAIKDFDGGYAMVGLIGHGDAFVIRDPNSIRPVYYYIDDEVIVAASERPAIQTTFNVPFGKIRELEGGSALLVKKNGKARITECIKKQERKACSFERIYFSRGTDHVIYQERKNLGKYLAPIVLEAIDHDIENTVFSFIPNTAEVAFYGLKEGLDDWLNQYKLDRLKKLTDKKAIEKLIQLKPRIEKVAVKDVKLRTFITKDESRDELVSHVYDITYGSVRRGVDNLVIIDDSIVRGTTLRQSILSNLDRLGPKRIIVVSSAPQIRYPDCYGIDMSKLRDFVAFRAAIALTKERGNEALLTEVYHDCIEMNKRHYTKATNQVKRIYDQFTPEEISNKIAEIIRPNHIFSNVSIIYQTIENLHRAIPDNLGDWYFTGNFPTPGGNKVVNKAFINYMEGKNVRAY